MDEINASYKQSLIREQLEEEHDLNREKDEWKDYTFMASDSSQGNIFDGSDAY